SGSVYLQDVVAASGGIRVTTSPEEVFRYNMRRAVSVTADVATADLGRVRRDVLRAIAEAGEVPRGVNVDVRGQLATLDLVETSLTRGLLAAVLAIFLLLVAYFQSIRLGLVAVAALPATLLGVGLTLWLTGTTLNLQSFMGAIMALGVSVANAILLVTFAERARVGHGGGVRAAGGGGRGRPPPVPVAGCARVARVAAAGGGVRGRRRAGGGARPAG